MEINNNIMFARYFGRQLLCQTNLLRNSRVGFCSSQEPSGSKTSESRQEGKETEDCSASSLSSQGQYVLVHSATFFSFDPTLNFGIRNM